MPIVTSSPARVVIAKRCVGQCAKDSRFAVLVQEVIPSMALPQSNFTGVRAESADPFAMQLALSRVHARLVPMQSGEQGYVLDPSAESWFELPAAAASPVMVWAARCACCSTYSEVSPRSMTRLTRRGVNFAHGEVALTQFRVDNEGVCRLVPLTARHSTGDSTPAAEALGHLSPERLLGDTLDARADVFSAGVLLWEALAGRRSVQRGDGVCSARRARTKSSSA